MRFNIIVAMDKNRVIGKNNDLPWRLPADLAYFKKTTNGYPIIMGRKTFESLGKALPGRENIVLTRNELYKSKYKCTVLDDIGLTLRSDFGFLIGGAELYSQYLDKCDKLYITHINHEFEGDTYFPEIDYSKFKEISREPGIKDDKNPYDYEYVIYERIRG